MTKTHTELLRALISAQVSVVAHADELNEEVSEGTGPILNQLDFWLTQARKLVKQLSQDDRVKDEHST